jgi:large subunit ribosomal protein L13
MNTVVPSGKDIQRNWHVIDASGAALGRIASQAAHILMGKNKAVYTPYIDMGDHVVIVNAEKVRLTGRKEEQKLYRYHSGYPGGLTEISAKKMRATRPMKMVEEADGHQTEGLRGRSTSASGPEACGSGSNRTVKKRGIRSGCFDSVARYRSA